MAADNSVVAKVELPPLTPQKLKSKLAPTPANPPKYAVTVKNAAGQDVILGSPVATRAPRRARWTCTRSMAARPAHWGGPAAFAEVNAAIHGVMFAAAGTALARGLQLRQRRGPCRKRHLRTCGRIYGFDGMTFEDLKGFRCIKSKLTGHGGVAPESRGRAALERPARFRRCRRRRASRSATSWRTTTA
jgi:transketolase